VKGADEAMEEEKGGPTLRNPDGWEGSNLAAALCDKGVSSWNGYRGIIVGGARGRVLEIGVGTGANLPYYSSEIEHLTGMEPDAAMLRRARKRAEELGRQVEWVQGRVEALPFPDASFDTVVGTLMLCSVSDVRVGLSEVLRVLKPGGQFRFLEHVRSEAAWAARLQDWVTPLWRRCTAGCHPNRDTEQSIRAAGFEIVERRRLRVGIGLASPTLIGVAVKPIQGDSNVAGGAEPGD
jgi:SAM-dependent methyltransferase